MRRSLFWESQRAFTEPGTPGETRVSLGKLGMGPPLGFLNGNGKRPFLRWETHPRMVISWGLMGLDFFGDLWGDFPLGDFPLPDEISTRYPFRMESHIVHKTMESLILLLARRSKVLQSLQDFFGK